MGIRKDLFSSGCTESLCNTADVRTVIDAGSPPHPVEEERMLSVLLRLEWIITVRYTKATLKSLICHLK